MKNRNIIFIVLFILILCIGFSSLFTDEKNESVAEARVLNKYKHFTFNDFLEGTYQDHLEDTIMDQLILSGTVKKTMQPLLSIHNNLLNYQKLCQNKYLKIGKIENGKIYNFNCDDYIIYGNKTPKELNERLQLFTKAYSHLNEIIDVYYYYVPSSENFNFEENSKVVNVIDYLNNNMKKPYHIDELKYNNYEEYKNYFYKTDHHWNYKGSYQGYKDIYKLLNVSDKMLEPTEEKTYNVNFFGSFSRYSRFYNFKEKLSVYKYKIPYSFTTRINGVVRPYDYPNEYDNGTFKKTRAFNHYARYYGGDYSEVIYDFDNPKKDNLLIISNSFSNAVNKLIASHFNKTFVVDLRHYENFNIENYLRIKKVDKVLILFNDSFLEVNDFMLKWGDK